MQLYLPPILAIHINNVASWNWWSLNGTQWNTQKHNNERVEQVPKIKRFNKIHVKHQNTEMAKKKKKILVFFILYKLQWFKNITNF